MTKYSESMQSYMDANNIDPKRVCYLTIAKVHLERIVRGEKTVEFRDLSDHYLKKFFEISGDESSSTGRAPKRQIRKAHSQREASEPTQRLRPRALPWTMSGSALSLARCASLRVCRLGDPIT